MVREIVLVSTCEGDICYTNQSAQEVFSSSAREMLGRSLADVLRFIPSEEVVGEHSSSPVDDLERLARDRTVVLADLLSSNGSAQRFDTVVTAMQLGDDDTLFILMFHKEHKPATINLVQMEVLIEEVNRNRERIRNLQEALGHLPLSHLTPAYSSDLQAIDSVLKNLRALLTQDDIHDALRRLAVDLMTHALTYWEETTGLSKADLAEISGLWNVQVYPDGWRRTQVLDKYLDPASIPSRPRWRKVKQTAEFVLSYRSEDTANRQLVIQSLNALLLSL